MWLPQGNLTHFFGSWGFRFTEPEKADGIISMQNLMITFTFYVFRALQNHQQIIAVVDILEQYWLKVEKASLQKRNEYL